MYLPLETLLGLTILYVMNRFEGIALQVNGQRNIVYLTREIDILY